MTRIAAGLVVVVAAAAGAAPMHSAEVHAPVLPRPGLGADARRAEAAPRANEACVTCHADIAAEWQASRHRTAYTDPAFQRALALEPLAFCRGCHAPEAPSENPAPPDLAALGVACVTCHLAGDTVLAAPSSSAARASPHPTLRTAAFASPAACAGCHEFDFPDTALRAEPEKMQSTLTEHAASDRSGEPCASCHMPFVGEGRGRHRSHAFASSRDPEGPRRALSITATRRGGEVAITLAAGEVGHAFPTGDLFRRLAVTAEVVGEDRALIAYETRYLARRFRSVAAPGGYRIRVTVGDDRPGAPSLEGAPSVVGFDLGERAAGRTIAVRVAYQRVAHAADGHEREAEVESEQTIFEQDLDPGGESR